jgi:hypothetical protein
MTAARETASGNLARYPNAAELRFKQVLNGRIQLIYLEYAPLELER